MGLEDMKPRTAFLLLVGSAITILFIMSCTSLWRNNYHEAVLFLVLGAGLTFVFFRKRILVLASIGCAFLLVSAGLTAIFHPSVHNRIAYWFDLFLSLASEQTPRRYAKRLAKTSRQQVRMRQWRGR